MKYDQNKYYYDGYAARTNNCAYEECELKLGTPSRLDWCQGWRDAGYDSRKKSSTPDLENTNQQFESLAASQQPSWNGEGLPPVGTICEALAPVGKGEMWSWQRVKVVESGIDGAEKECLVYNLETTMPSWVDEFRSIRTEAELRREAFIESLMTEWLFLGHDGDQAVALYDAIAAGKIPGVKLEVADE